MDDERPEEPADLSRSGRRVKRWLNRLTQSRAALPWLGVASVAETLIVPIPIELVLIPFMAVNRHRIWATAAVVTLGCMVAAIIGYYVGYFFYGTIGVPIMDYMGWTEGMDAFRALFAEWGFWAIIAIGIIPIPFQVGLLAAGAAQYPVLLFLAAAGIARGIRYFGLATLVWWLGEGAERVFKDNIRTVATVLILAIAAFFLWKALSA